MERCLGADRSAVFTPEPGRVLVAVPRILARWRSLLCKDGTLPAELDGKLMANDQGPASLEREPGL
jgi:hypothetical protein